MNSRNVPIPKSAGRLFVIVSALVAPIAFGQTVTSAASPTSASQKPEETIQLSAFEVSSSTDRGYIATRASGATKTNTPMIELPHSIQVLNKEFITDTNSETVFQATRYVSNVVGGSQRGDDAILVRGFAVTRLRNGQPYAAGNAFTFDEMAAFERVEVIKGASAVLYGSASPGGLLNLVDKRPLSKRQSSLSFTAGSYDFYKGVLDSTGPLGKFGEVAVNYRVIGSYEDSQSWRDFASRKRNYINGALDFTLGRNTNLWTRIEYQKDDLVDSYGKPYIWFSAANVGTLLNLPDKFFRGDPGIDTKRVERFSWETSVQHDFNSNWSVKGTLGYADAFGTRTEVFISAQGPTISLFPRFAQYIPNDQEQWVGEVNVLGKFQLGSTHHQLLAGGNITDRDTRDRNIRYAISPDPFNIFNPVYFTTVLGNEVTNVRRIVLTTTRWESSFIQDQFGIFGDRLQFIAGVRKDKLKQSVKSYVTGVTSPNNDDQVSPRYGVLWRITPQWSLYGSYNESFTPASGAGSVQGIPFPSPTAEQTELGVKFELLNGRVFGGVAVFENIRRNQTTTDVLNPGFSVATGEITSKGSELDVGVSITDNWQVLLGVGFQKAEITADNVPVNVGLEQFNVPNQMASMWTKYQFRNAPVKGLSLGLGVTYVGERAGQRDSVVRSFPLPAYTTFNGLVAYQHGAHKIALNIENIFDKRYIMIGSARLADPGEHRSLRFTYTIGF
jgi:iron complex outermembrane receptor protein